jgi:hypothetical protein
LFFFLSSSSLRFYLLSCPPPSPLSSPPLAHFYDFSASLCFLSRYVFSSRGKSWVPFFFWFFFNKRNRPKFNLLSFELRNRCFNLVSIGQRGKSGCFFFVLTKKQSFLASLYC